MPERQRPRSGGVAPSGTGLRAWREWRARWRESYYGWRVVGAVFVMMATTAGIGFYNMSVLLGALSRGRFEVSEVSGATAAFFLASGLGGMIAGRLIERHDARFVIAISGALSAAVLALVGQVSTVAELYAFYIAFGLLYAGCALVPGTTLVARWFARRRGAALSIASTGLSIGGIVFAPLSAWLIETRGLEEAALWLAGMFFIGVVPAALFLIRPSPASMGLRIDGDPPLASGEAEPPADGVRLRAAVRSRFFIGVTLAYVFAMMAQVGGLSHQFRLVSLREDAGLAALAVSVLAGASIVGRLAGGAVLARVSMRGFTLAFLALQALGLALFSQATGAVALLGASALFGLTVGNILMLQPLLLGEAFGLRDYGRIFSLSQAFGTLGVAAGPALVGLVYESAGGYGLAYLVIAGGSCLALLIFAAAGPIAAARRGAPRG